VKTVKLERVLIVGGGMAGLHCARLLREHGFAGGVTLLGVEPHVPYDRPPLSKAVLRPGRLDTVEDLAFPFDFAAGGIQTRFGERAIAWAPGLVTTDSGAKVPYDALIVAAGAEPLRLPFAPPEATTLRTYEDALRLRERLVPGRRVGIVGAGWIGAEVATAARAAGCEVHVFEGGEAPLATVFPAEIGHAMAAWYKEAGVHLWLASPVTQIDPPPAGDPDVTHTRVGVSWGEYAEVDEVLIAVGARPDLRWLGPTFQYAPDGALHVTEQLATSVPGVWAVGDCAQYRSVRYGRHIRVEHWDNALRGPETVVANVLGGSAVHDPVPYFWSEQFGRMVQFVGRHSPGDAMVVRGDLAGPKWSVCWLDEHHRLSAVLAVNQPRDLAQARRLVAAGTAMAAARVAEPGTALTAATL
jgi:NADPH-dependent 2,4-dienoyl-CoA reductase/sulfur reductase-like enzyme